MIPRFIHEQLIDNCDILVEMFKRYEKIKAKNNMEIKEEKETAYKETEGKLHYELDFEFITQMAERMASNKKEGKYSMYNWMKPMSKTDLINLIQAQYRHAMDLMNFKFDDDGRPYGTLEAFSNNAMMINYQLKTYFKDYKFSNQDLLEIQVSPSTKIKTTYSTGLLTEEK